MHDRDALMQALETFIADWKHRARRAFVDATAEADGSFPRRGMEHGAMCYVNAADALERIVREHQPISEVTMSERTPKTWTIEIGRVGQTCRILCDGIPILNAVSADLHLDALSPSTLHVKLARPHPLQVGSSPRFQPGDAVTAEGTPAFTTIELGGRLYRLTEIYEGDIDDGLFGERRRTGASHQEF